MKMAITIFLVLTLGLISFPPAYFLRGETLAPNEVLNKWGNQEFDFDEFRNGDELARSRMAYQVLSNKEAFAGMFVTDVREKLGTPTGYYFSDTFPAYLIQRAETRKEEAWQIVFLLNQERKVTDVIVHKNCCD